MMTVDRTKGLARAARNAAAALALCLLPLTASADASPPLLYQIGKGVLSYNGQILASGHAGRYEGRDNRAMENAKNRGPIPEGVYAIGPPQNNWLGDGAMPLTPTKDTRTFGRTAFWIHRQLYPQGTHGCIGLTPEGLKQVADLRRANKVGVLVVQP